MKRITVLCLILSLLMIALTAQTRAQYSQPQSTTTPPAQETVAPQPTTTSYPPLFQIGAMATEDGAAVSFWVDDNAVRMLYVYADGQYFLDERTVLCVAIQATAAIGGNLATVFVLCDNGNVVHLRFDLCDMFAAEFAVPTALYLPLIIR